MYSKLLQGETISKARFCLETECHSRSFDRDIEDIRLFLSESYNTSELIYDRRKGGYFLTETVQQPLENIEYLLVEKVLLDSGVLRKDEMDGLLLHIAMHTENVKGAVAKEQYAINRYVETEQKKPSLKLFEDLNTAIDNHQVIRIYGDKFQQGYMDAIPHEVRCQGKKIWLIAVAENDGHDLRVPLEEIEGFSIIRNQRLKEMQQA
jgi:predicted DNA-binding transcriptional regulator YafY